MREMIVK